MMTKATRTGELQERAVGLEGEYCFSSRVTDKLEVGAKTVLSNMLAYPRQKGITLSHYNGGSSHMYNELVEYRTPECRPNEVAAYLLAGERMLLDAVEKSNKEARQKLQLEKVPTEPTIHLRVAGSGMKITHSETSGYHENYEVLDSGGLGQKELLSTMMLMGFTWTGAGKLVRVDSSQQLSLVPMQKILCRIGSNKQHHLLKDESITHSPRNELRHVDYPLMPFVLKNRYSFMSGVCRLSEVGEAGSVPILHDKERAEVDVTADAAMTKTYRMLDGSVMTALEHQIAVAEAVVDAGQRLGFPEYEVEAARSVGELCSAIDHDIAAGKEHVGFLSKWAVLASAQDRAERNAGALSQAEMVRLEIAHDLSGRDGYADKIRNRQADLMPSESEVSHAITSPPDGRAAARVELFDTFERDKIFFNAMRWRSVNADILQNGTFVVHKLLPLEKGGSVLGPHTVAIDLDPDRDD